MPEPTSIIALVLQAIIGVAAAVAAYYGYKNHGVGQSNAVKLDEVKVATNGTNTALASSLATTQGKNEDLIRTLAASNIPLPPSTPKEGPNGSL
jgi:hypothetical protein